MNLNNDACEMTEGSASPLEDNQPLKWETVPRGAVAPIGKVLVLGLGKSGKSVVKYCADLLGTRVESMFIAAGAETPDSRAFVESFAVDGVDYAFGDDALARFADAGVVFDVCIASPGIPFYHDLYTAGLAHSFELISEVEFAWRESSPESTWVAITGTNGKTTTTSCAAHVLRSCGFAADAVGNIGDVCLDAVSAGDTQVYVAEVSSYQLYSTRYFAPDVAVMLNITPDHLHWHRTLEAYRDAKFKLLDNMQCAFGEGKVPPAPAEAPAPRTSAAAAELGPSGCGEGKVPPAPAEAPAPRTSAAAAELARFAGSDSPRSRCALTSSQLQRELEAPSPRLGGLGVAILDATNDVVRAKVRALRQMTDAERGFDYVPMGTVDGIGGDMRARCGARNAAYIDGSGRLVVALGEDEHVLVSADELQIKGEHNASNALAAAAVAVALGAHDEDISQALKAFAPLEHRIEPCGSVAGVDCYNDSKATNVDATVKALGAFPGRRLIVLLGGDDKGTDLSELVAATCAHASVAVCYGAGGPRFAEAFEEALAGEPGGAAGEALADATGGAAEETLAGEPGDATGGAAEETLAGEPGDALADATGGASGDATGDVVAPDVVAQASEFVLVRAEGMESAFDAALAQARPGDVVLLSPACASFDEFKSFEHRGHVFKQLVAERAAKVGA